MSSRTRTNVWDRALRVGVKWAVGLLLLTATPLSAQDRTDELEDLRGQIDESRERVSSHEADERALLEQLEETDRILMEASRARDSARHILATARERLEAIEPQLVRAREKLEGTQRALSARAVALYRGGEMGPVRVLFSSESLPEMLSRASALRVLVRHDATLVDRQVKERDRLAALQAEAEGAFEAREKADADFTRLAAELRDERIAKRKLLASVRKSRKGERQLLLELEQAAQALEETIRTLGAKSQSSSGAPGTGFAARKGKLTPPVSAKVAERFGKVVDPEFQTKTFRSGIDFAAPSGDSVLAVAEGIVRFAGWFRGYGRIVIVDHGDDFHTISGHLDEIRVTVGTKVAEGESLGTVGETGSLGGPSLYFELRQGGKPVDPEPWLLDARG